jgi:hypothetical protein
MEGAKATGIVNGDDTPPSSRLTFFVPAVQKQVISRCASPRRTGVPSGSLPKERTSGEALTISHLSSTIQNSLYRQEALLEPWVL